MQSIAQQAISTYGVDVQLNKVIKECAELILAIHHEKDRKCDAKAVITEVADVSIMMEQMKVIYGAEEVEKEIARKLEILARRLGVDNVKNNVKSIA